MKQYRHIPTNKLYKSNGANGLIRVDNSTNVPLPLWVKDNSKDWEEVEEPYPLRTLVSVKIADKSVIYTKVSEFLWKRIDNGLPTYGNSYMLLLLREKAAKLVSEMFTNIGDDGEGNTIACCTSCGQHGILMFEHTCQQKPKQREWEITAFRSLKNSTIIIPMLNGISNYTNIARTAEKDFLNLPLIWEIYSVKRLTDKVELKVGDTINLTTGKEKIRGFDINSYIMNVKFQCTMCSITNYDINIVKDKMFRTADGVDIYEGDKYYFVVTEKGTGHPMWEVIQSTAKKGVDYASPAWKDFAKCANAEYFALHHARKLSIADIQKIYVSAGYTHKDGKPNKYFEALKKLVNSR